MANNLVFAMSARQHVQPVSNNGRRSVWLRSTGIKVPTTTGVTLYLHSVTAFWNDIIEKKQDVKMIYSA